jgi:hypothetical protein
LLEFFRDNACHPDKYGEGKELLGRLNLTTDAAGNAPIDHVFTVPLPPGTAVAATASLMRFGTPDETSEFSRCVPVTEEAELAAVAGAGADTIELDDASGISAGDQLMLDPGGDNEELVTVGPGAVGYVMAAATGLTLRDPLVLDHAAGEAVVRVDMPETNGLWGDIDCSGAVDAGDLLRILGW